MKVDAVALLRELDFAITAGSTAQTWSLRSPDGTFLEAQMIPPIGRITAHAARGVAAPQVPGAIALLVGHSITPALLADAKAGRIDVLVEEPLQLVARGTVYSPAHHQATPPQQPAPSRRSPWIRWAVARCLLLADKPMRQSMIAEILGTTQQSVSNAIRTLGHHASQTEHGYVAADKGALLDHWVRNYPGPGGLEFGWYSLKPIVEQTVLAAEVSAALNAHPLIGGDVAADSVAPWKLPTTGRVYIDVPVDLGKHGFVPAPLEDATLITCVPRDPTLWRRDDPARGIARSASDLADAVIIYWDVLTSAGPDSQEAAEHLKEVIAGART